jgi:hypothetical protein
MRYFGKMQYSRADHRRLYNKAHALWMSDNWRHRLTLRICSSYCFSAATMVTPTRRNVVFYVYCPSFDFTTDYVVGPTQWVFPLLFSGVQRSTLCPKRRVLIRIPNPTRWEKFNEAMALEVIYRGQSHTELCYVCLILAATRLLVDNLE